MGSRRSGIRGGARDGALVIRRAVERDAGRLTRMVRTSGAYEAPYAAMVDGYRVGPDYISAHRVFVAAEGERGDGEVMGFYALLVDPVASAELDLLFVADRAQGLGIGRLLIEHLRGEARRAGAGSVRIVSHPPAEGFYRSVGARRIGTVPANPPAVVWDRPELALSVGPALAAESA